MFQAGFVYHLAEPVYVMLTLWLPDYPPALPSAALHQIGSGALVKNDKREVKIISVLRRRRTVDDLSAKDEMCKNITDVCIPGHQQHYGFTACQAMLKPDVKLMDFARDEIEWRCERNPSYTGRRTY